MYPFEFKLLQAVVFKKIATKKKAQNNYKLIIGFTASKNSNIQNFLNGCFKYRKQQFTQI